MSSLGLKVTRLAVLAGAFCLVSCQAPAQQDTDEPVGLARQSDDIKLDDYELTFSEDFDARLDVSGSACNTRWIAHTPWWGDFGDAKFVDPSNGHPFNIEDGRLRITAQKEYDGSWTSGLLSSGNTCGGGFAQQYGYFEMSAKLPEGEGLWPAFWLIGRNRVADENAAYSAEIDVIEHLGHMPGSYSSTLHIHARNDTVTPSIKSKRHRVPSGSLYDRYNTYGVSIEEDVIIIYLNRQEVWRAPTPEKFRLPFFILVNLGMGSGFSIKNTPDPSHMYVDYIRVWQKKERLTD